MKKEDGTVRGIRDEGTHSRQRDTLGMLPMSLRMRPGYKQGTQPFFQSE